jgi:hypothetical protein
MKTVAVSVAAFAIAFFATALIRRTAPAPVTAPLKVRPKESVREVADRRRESKPDEDVRPPAPKTWSATMRREYEVRIRAMVVKKMQRARAELDLTEAQLAAYELRLGEAAQKDPMLALGDWNRADGEALVPLLDSRQHARYLEHTRKGAEEEARTETRALARTLSVDAPVAERVHRLLREEGVVQRDAFLALFDRPEEAKRLLDRVAFAMERVRARARSLLSPTEFGRLDGHLVDEAAAMEIFVDESLKVARQ